jgi:hypothetical protein
MQIFLSVLITLSGLFVSVAQAQDAQKECVSQAEMKEISGHFRQFAKLANADFCNDDSKEWHLVSSLMFMRHTQFAGDMPNSKDEFFTGKFAKDWYGYFIGRIDNLEVVNDCPKGVIAYVYMFGDKTMYTCPMALTKSFSSLDRASVMMHEARHIDGFPHITCSKGARQGLQGACDKKIADGGSYAVTVETYAQLAKYAQGIHPAMKAYARASSVVYADEAFESAVKINRTEKLLALTQDTSFFSMDTATNQLKKLGNALSIGKIVRRAQHMILFPTDKTIKVQYVFANNEGTIEQSPSDFVTEYNAQTPEQKANLVDLHIGAQWSARVFKNSVTFACDPKSPNLTEIKLPAGATAANLIYPEGYARDKYTVSLSTTTGDVLELSCVGKKASVKSVAMRMDQQFDRVHKVNGIVYGIAQGNLFTIDGAGRSTPLTTELSGQIVEIVPQQTFEFFEN